MKIAWFTPFSRKSAIGKFSQMVTQQLSTRAEVHLWIAESQEAELWETRLPVHRFRPETIPLVVLAGFDQVVYNLGDHLGNHEACYLALQKHPGVVVLHDWIMHHFFAEYFLTKLQDPAAYSQCLEFYYGLKGRQAAQFSLGGQFPQVWATDEVVQYPFFEKVLVNSRGVVTHSDFLAQKVKAHYLGPVKKIDFPNYGAAEPRQAAVSRQALGLPEDSLVLLTVGNVNPNKRLDVLLRVLGENQKALGRMVFVALGACTQPAYLAELHDLVRQYHLEKQVRFLGFQPDDVLHSYLKTADLFVNLRNPAMEGASASLVEQMFSGKPSVVSDHGFYSEMPDDCVIKINPQDEPEQLCHALKKFAHHPQALAETGARAKAFAEAHFRADRYAENLLEFFPEVQAVQPLLNLVDKVGRELSDLGVASDFAAVDVATREIARIFEKA